MTKHYCQFIIRGYSGFVVAYDDKDYECCGKIAHFNIDAHATCSVLLWLCTEHYDLYRSSIQY